MSRVRISLEDLTSSFSSRSLNLILLPTEKCNFRCTYCYEDFEIGKMGPETRAGIKSLLSRRIPELSRLDVSWFGGEPLVAADVVREISRHIVRHGHDGLDYRGNMTTNGYLLDLETATELASLGIRYYQISLDGDEELHDRSRVQAGGKGTFARIWQNLMALRDSDLEFTVMVRVHYTADNVFDLGGLVTLINRELAGDSRFEVYFKSVERLGGPNDDDIKRFSDELNERVKQRLDQTLNDPRQIYQMERPYICYASKPNSLMIRANGEIGKCTVAFHDDRNTLGRIHADGSLEIDQQKLRLWAVGFTSLDEHDLACPWGQMNAGDGDGVVDAIDVPVARILERVSPS